MPVPVHQLTTTDQYLAVPTATTPLSAGRAVRVLNSGYVVLALIAERTGGAPFLDLPANACVPAGMDTAFLRRRAPRGPPSDIWTRTDRGRHPAPSVRGSDDGGMYSTAADVSALWLAFFAGRIVSRRWVEEMVRPRSDVPKEDRRYGLGFWLHETRANGWRRPSRQEQADACEAFDQTGALCDRRRQRLATGRRRRPSRSPRFCRGR
jgi:CubicO group peptidase (beta-lactamase class C family)